MVTPEQYEGQDDQVEETTAEDGDYILDALSIEYEVDAELNRND